MLDILECHVSALYINCVSWNTNNSFNKKLRGVFWIAEDNHFTSCWLIKTIRELINNEILAG